MLVFAAVGVQIYPDFMFTVTKPSSRAYSLHNDGFVATYHTEIGPILGWILTWRMKLQVSALWRTSIASSVVLGKLNVTFAKRYPETESQGPSNV